MKYHVYSPGGKQACMDWDLRLYKKSNSAQLSFDPVGFLSFMPVVNYPSHKKPQGSKLFIFVCVCVHDLNSTTKLLLLISEKK